MIDFVHLHNHTDMSLLDGAQSVSLLLDTVQGFGMKAVAVTEHGNLFSTINFYIEAKKRNIKPIIGCEVYVALKSRFDHTQSPDRKRPYHHLILLAQNEIGFKNLIKLVSKGYLEGFYHRPRVDKALLGEYNEGLLALSACIKGELPQALLLNDIRRAERIAREYQEIFPDRFFIELQDHGLNEEKVVLPQLVQLGKKLNIPLVATNDAHYALREHAPFHDVLLCIGSGKKLDEEDRMRYETDQLYIKSQEEMEELFRDYPEALSNTIYLADLCNLELELGRLHLPEFPLPEERPDLTARDYLRELVEEGLKKRYEVITDEIRQRVEFELATISKMNFDGYFLVVHDFVDYAHRKGIPVGPGRGSAAGSIVAYALGITQLDPLRYNLLFERFLNPDRVSMPDIDIDFCIERRQEVIDYIKRKYGEKSVTQIITFGTLKTRGVIRDVGRVMGMSYGEVDRIAKMIPDELSITIDEALAKNPELKQITEKNKNYGQLIEYARLLSGLTRNSGVHPAGVVIAPGDLLDYVPLCKSSHGEAVITQWDLKSLDHVGMLKVDLLGLRNLTLIDKTLKILASKGSELDLERIPLNDEKTFQLFSRGDTIGVFQFESAGMRRYLRKLKPTCIEDLIAMNALYRPGPMEMIDEFIDRKHGRVKVEYLHPGLEEILKETHGIIVYQEQVMQIAHRIAGFKLSEADAMRKAIGKKMHEKMQSFREKFIKGAEENGVERRTAIEIWNQIEKFASYGFNKSHSAAYALLAYKIAYLKAHYPGEFMAANLTTEVGNANRIVTLANDVMRQGMRVLPPDVNQSDVFFTYEDNSVRYGLAAIKNVGEKAAEEIVVNREKEGPYRSLFDFCSRVDLHLVNKKTLESLVLSGAMDSLPGHRAAKFKSVEKALQYGQRLQKPRNLNQLSLFGAGGGLEINLREPTLEEVEPYSEQEQWAQEKELLGLYMSGHPLSQYEEEIRRFSNIDLSAGNLEANEIPERILIGGIISNTKPSFKKNRQSMHFILNSLDGSVRVICNNDNYNRFRNLIQDDRLVFVSGKPAPDSADKEMITIFLDDIFHLEQACERLAKKIVIRLDARKIKEYQIFSIEGILKSSPGKCKVFFDYMSRNGERLLIEADSVKVSSDRQLIEKLRNLCGKENVWYNS